MTQSKNNQIFRPEALERLSSPERLDQMVQVVTLRSWVPLGVVSCLLGGVLLWSIFGRIPITVTGQGILLQPRTVMQLQANSNGRILTVLFKPGDTIQQGQTLATLDQSELQQQLQQQQAKLAELQQQIQQSDRLQQQQIDLERRTLEQQRQDLQATLQREKITPLLKEQNDAAIAQKRQSLAQQINQSTALVQSMKDLVDKQEDLLHQGVISQATYLQAEQNYLDAQNQLETARSTLQELTVQSTTNQQQYLENLNRLDTVKTNLRDLDSQIAKLNVQSQEKRFEQINQVEDLKQQIAKLALQLTNQGKIISDYDGRVLEVNVAPGQVISSGTALGMLSRWEETTTAKAENRPQLESLAYFSDSDGKQIQPGMTVQVTPSTVKRERFGGIVGVVTSVSAFPVSNQNVETTIGQPDLGSSLVGGKPARIEVIARFQVDPNTTSGYRWSSSRGPNLQLSPGTTTQVRVQVGERAPISYIIPILRSTTGIY